MITIQQPYMFDKEEYKKISTECIYVAKIVWSREVIFQVVIAKKQVRIFGLLTQNEYFFFKSTLKRKMRTMFAM